MDATLLFAAVTLGLCVWALLRDRYFPAGTVVLFGLFLALAFGFSWSGSFSDYATQKSLRLFSLTALAAFAPLLLIRNDNDRIALVIAVVFLGSLMAALTLLDPGAYGVKARGTVWNVNPIVLARASGFAVLGLVLFYWHARLSLWQVLLPAAVAMSGLLLSGSRGPLVAVMLAVLASTLTLSIRGVPGRRAFLTLFLGGLCTLGALVWLASSNYVMGRRVLRLLTGDWLAHDLTRLTLWKEAGLAILEHPFGLGWGRFSETVAVFHKNEVLALYPHNIFLEIFVEAGWLAGVAFTCLVCWLLKTSFKKASRNEGVSAHLVFAGLVYWLLCAFFSGDVNDNRPFWMFLAVSLSSIVSREPERYGTQRKKVSIV